MTWQPIETAPKDGTEIDLWLVDYKGDGSRMADARWGEDWDGRARIKRFGWVAPSQYYGEPGLCDDLDTPTHWMPRPAPPSAE